MNINFLGGAMEVGGSCIYVRVGGYGILMDAGIRQSANKDPLPDFRCIQGKGGIDVIIISHAHMDHIGSLPVISKAYPEARIYMTNMSLDLTRVLLYDSLKIMDKREGEIPHYSENDVKNMLNRICPMRFQAEWEILKGLKMIFYPAGHIAGAACVYLKTSEGTIFYSGDFSGFAQKTIEGIKIPKLRPDVAFFESTYGNRLHSNRQVEERRLVTLVNECIQEGKKVLIPAFALGRSQEVILILKNAMQNNEIPKTKIYVDGMVRDINSMYHRNPTFLKNSLAKSIMKGNEPFYNDYIKPVTVKDNRDELINQKGAAIFIASSGMLMGGPSMLYAQALAKTEDACIIITGYQDEEAPGRELIKLLENDSKNRNTDVDMNAGTNADINVDANAGTNADIDAGAKTNINVDTVKSERTIKLDGKQITVKCRICQVGLSAHADCQEICSVIDMISPRHVFLVHGDDDAIKELGSQVNVDYKRRVYQPKCGEEYDIQIREQRKQIEFRLEYSMQKKTAFSQDNAKELWKYIRENYPKKMFTIEQMAYIWYGHSRVRDDYADKLVDTKLEEIYADMNTELVASDYFDNDVHRLFLYRASDEDEVAKKQMKEAVTVQQIEACVKEHFGESAYKKMSFHTDEKKVILNYEFPDTVDREEFEKCATAVRKKTEWNVCINESTDHNAAMAVIVELFGNRAGKTSYYVDKKLYNITLRKENDDDMELLRKFKEKTGWNIAVKNSTMTSEGDGDNNSDKVSARGGKDGISTCKDNILDNSALQCMEFLPEDAECLEQNMALACIDMTFEEAEYEPYKKSIKNDANGRYIELSFLSPYIGQKCANEMISAAKQTGWRLKISDSVNQNEIIKILLAMCAQYDIALAKNPSYMPATRSFKLKNREEYEADVTKQFCKEFEKKTGCKVEF